MEGQKDSANKPSFLELYPKFLLEMAKRLNSNKIDFGGKYEVFNFKKPIDVNSLLDASFRHLIDVHTIVNYPEDNPESSESLKEHLAALAINSMLIYYQLYNDKTTITGNPSTK